MAEGKDERFYQTFTYSVSKPQIRKVFETLFDVKVIAVNTHILPTKKKRLGLNQGFKARYKRAIITIKAGQTIPILGDS